MRRSLRLLSAALLAVLLVPWAVGAAWKTQLQPGLADQPERAAMLVDFIVAGTVVAGLSMWVVAACAVMIVAVMRGPRRDADAFPVDAPRR
jgi:heme/copper-type cytochrome/quinol oxidase subunit 2